MGTAQKIHIFGIFKITDNSKEYNVDSGQIVLNSILKFKEIKDKEHIKIYCFR